MWLDCVGGGSVAPHNRVVVLVDQSAPQLRWKPMSLLLLQKYVILNVWTRDRCLCHPLPPSPYNAEQAVTSVAKTTGIQKSPLGLLLTTVEQLLTGKLSTEKKNELGTKRLPSARIYEASAYITHNPPA